MQISQIVTHWQRPFFPFLSFLCKCSTHVRLPSQVEDDENVTAVPNSKNSCKGEDISINLQPASAYEFGQSLNAARSSGNTVACAELLASTAPEMLPQFLSTQLDGHTINFIMQALHSHLLEKDPYLVYQHLNHLHTADRFSVRLACKYGLKSWSLFVRFCNQDVWWQTLTHCLQVVLMLLEKDERHHMTQLFEHLSAVQSTQFTKNDVQNLANKYIWPSPLCMSCSTTALGSMQNTAQELSTQRQEAAEWAIQLNRVDSLYWSVMSVTI